MSKGTLYLIPSLMGGKDASIIPQSVKDVINRIEVFIVEKPKSARHFMKDIGFKGDFNKLTMLELNKRTDPADTYFYLDAAEDGKDIGLISEAGAPGVADPGASIVTLAHLKGIRVQPMVGPSSIMLALMGSGLEGQSFCFHGYLPIDSKQRQREIKKLEHLSLTHQQSQIFMEAPYRNNQLLKDILKACHDETKLCIAANLTTKKEFIKTKTIGKWKGTKPDINKQPTIFILLKT